jgi:hypothetical protein
MQIRLYSNSGKWAAEALDIPAVAPDTALKRPASIACRHPQLAWTRTGGDLSRVNAGFRAGWMDGSGKAGKMQ